MRIILTLILIGYGIYALLYLYAVFFIITGMFRKSQSIHITQKSHNLIEAEANYQRAKENYESICQLAEPCEIQSGQAASGNEISTMLHNAQLEIDEAQRALKDAEHCAQQGIHDADEARLAATGVEYGGYNPDLNLNPTMHHMVDEMNDNSMAWNNSFQDVSFDDPFPDYGWDNSSDFDNGFDPFSSGFDFNQL